jgi:alkylated DNA repair dioxygenase AlkB
MHGVTAKRRVAHLGWIYGYDSWKIAPGPPIPDMLQPLRERVATLINMTPPALEQALVTYYPAGAGIGWHRDAPMFGPIVIGVSLLGSCRLRFQRRTDQKRQVFEAPLEPRSVYILSGAARDVWQHSIPATKEPRFSVTFRTVNQAGVGTVRR